jgi:Tfp pilus assembly protein PilV
MRQDRGSSLVECLVAIGLLTSALVALAHLAAVAVQVNAGAKYRTVATIVATQKVEQIRAVPALQDVAEAVEQLNGRGEVICEGDVACAGAVYRRRWSIGPVTTAPGSVLIQVWARHVQRIAGEIHLVTIRARNGQ